MSQNDEIAAQFARLDLVVPTTSVLPRNFLSVGSEDEFVFEQLTSTVRTLGRRVGLEIDVPGAAAYRTIHEKDHEIVAPVIQFSQAFLLEGGATLAVKFLEELAAYVASRWGPRKTVQTEAALEVVVTYGKRAKRITYRGPIVGLPEIVKLAQTVFDGEGDDC